MAAMWLGKGAIMRTSNWTAATGTLVMIVGCRRDGVAIIKRR